MKVCCRKVTRILVSCRLTLLLITLHRMLWHQKVEMQRSGYHQAVALRPQSTAATVDRQCRPPLLRHPQSSVRLSLPNPAAVHTSIIPLLHQLNTVPHQWKIGRSLHCSARRQTWTLMSVPSLARLRRTASCGAPTFLLRQVCNTVGPFIFRWD